MFLFTSVVLYAISLQLVHALPFVKRIVIDPLITSPNADTVWTPGNSEVVTWDTSAIPPTGTFTGMLLLGHPSAGSENLDLQNPLASGFSLRDGSVRVTCPTVSPGNDYIVVLFGDSGNASPQFTISGPSANQNSGSAISPNLVASPSAQPSPTASTTSVPMLAMTSTSSSDPSAPSLTMSTSATVPQAKSSPTGHSTLSTSPTKESDGSSSSTASISPTADSSRSNSNMAIPLVQNSGGMFAGALVSVFTIIFL